MQRTFTGSPSRRRGLTLAVVMAVVATVAIVSIAFLQSQSVDQRVADNLRAGDLALEAAEAGIAAELDAMQNPGWSGVTVPISAEVVRDARGVSTYTVSFERVASDGTSAGAAAAALQVRLRSVGRWLATGSSRPVERAIVTTVVVQPRLEGRPPRPDDVASADDRANDTVGFTEAQRFAVFATEGSDSFTSAPQTRIAGNVWLGSGLSLYNGLAWNNDVRTAFLSGLGIDNGGGTNAKSPHPLAGVTTFYTAPTSTQFDELTNQLKSPAITTETRLISPTFDSLRFRKYRLFEGGFQYEAMSIGSTLTASQNEMLRPTESNPLGIFYCSGSLTVGDGVVVHGTIVATSGVTFLGRGIAITSFDWRDGSGGTRVTDRDLWPHLPAVAAVGDVTFRAGSQTFIEGAVVTSSDVIVETPDLSLEPALLNYDGNAIAMPLGNGVSKVQVTDLLNILAGLTINTQHAVQFMNDDVWSESYPIVTANTLTGEFIVRGSADFPSATSCRFRQRRVHHADVLGPLVAKRVRFENPPAWSSVSSSGWTTKYNSWQTKRNGILGILLARPDLTFTQSLQEDDFPLTPTVRVSRPQNVNYACEPPLFSADAAARETGGGYRWQVTSWAEVSP